MEMQEDVGQYAERARTRRLVVLFEPSYELNSDEGRTRMNRLGYVKNLERTVNNLGAKVLDVTLLKNTPNRLNPTAAYVIQQDETTIARYEPDHVFSDPGLDSPLVKFDTFYQSPLTGLAYPIIGGIPVLRSNSAVLTSILSRD